MNVVQQLTPAKSGTGEPNYLSGFGNGFETEALPGALPVGRNSPQRCAYGLYAEQLSGSPFTAPRAANERSWLYRIRPTVANWGRFRKADAGLWRTAPCAEVEVPPAPMRWDPVPIPGRSSPSSRACARSPPPATPARQAGLAAHLYLATRSMEDEYFYNADGEMLVVPQQGELRLWTEFGVIDVAPGEVAVIPRGVKLRVELPAGEPARGYLCENYGGALTLPERGPIGANCLANPRDFLTPVAAYEDREAPSKLTVKWGGTLWETEIAALAARRGRLARQLRALQIRPPPLLAGRPGAVRPRRPVDLHRADLALGDPGHRQHRLRLLPRPLAGGREHLPPALVPHERHERVHGADLRRLRRQDRRRLRARRLLLAQHHAARTGRTWRPSRARAGPS